MKTYFHFHISCLLVSAGSVMISCQSKTYNKETNTDVKQLTMKEEFPNHKIAFEKINDQVFLYNPEGNKLFTIDLKKALYTVYFPDLTYSLNLFKINDFLYFLPKKAEENYTFAMGNVGTGIGTFSRENGINDLGLVNNEKREYPDENGKVKVNNVIYYYNKFAQLLKTEENGEIIIENKYDENAYIIESNTTKYHTKFQYNTEGQVTQEEIKNDADGSKSILNYHYNSLKQIEKKYNNDQTSVKEYQYDSNNKLVGIIEYTGTIDKYNPNKIINHFVKKIYTYNKEQIVEEKHYEYNIFDASILVNDKWEPITIEEQKKLAWQKLRDPSTNPLFYIERNYSYQSDEINVIVNKFSFSNTLKNGKNETDKKLTNSETITYTLDTLGRVVKKETINKDQYKEREIQSFSY
ncbi:hypothetical protein [Chryseobacterium sp. ERMR1:04]|uniref:hypothetical protein n=1 Tax=Chryseobacterium sp. ERMR1:04 TaxID=1705393 RepID=UPI000AF5EF04|nr:hypothetical protein [Chryseobacterium sp. ERMR1:04]